ncbi:AbgT family transporter [Salinithrix halophila]|uniref:AbgT family transporter n=2 Tax=Salinithrix halophila TaxID=1485204 RepID=A0ABV8JH55_9BACL
MSFLGWVERTGNRIPHPFTLFLYLIGFVFVVSWVGSLLGLAVVHPGTEKEIAIKSLISSDGLHYILESMVTNFTEFKPLGLVLVMMLGIGLANKVGLLEAAIKRTLTHTPKSVITYAVLFIGILGNLASDAAYIVIPPLAAMIFRSFGRHPIAGLAAGIAGVGCGFTANIFIGGTDAILSGITTEVAKVMDPDKIVTITDNWYFMSLSVIVLTFVGGFITERVVEPRLGTYKEEEDFEEKLVDLNPSVKRALRNTAMVALLYIGMIALVLFLPHSPLRGEDGGILVDSPFRDGIIPFLLGFFVLTGVTYGVTLKKISGVSDVVQYMTESIKDMAGFIVLVFVIAQFIAYINWSNLTVWIAVGGADLLKSIQMDGFPSVILFTLITLILSLLITSGSALWSVLAPIFIPMFMLLGYHPAFIQVAYRIADSATNMITPLNPFVAVMLGFLAKYDKKAGLGTHVSLLLPYTVAFIVVWCLMLGIFALFEIPVGPGVQMYL